MQFQKLHTLQGHHLKGLVDVIDAMALLALPVVIRTKWVPSGHGMFIVGDLGQRILQIRPCDIRGRVFTFLFHHQPKLERNIQVDVKLRHGDLVHVQQILFG